MTTRVQLQPYDEHNQNLESFVHPQEWKNVTPSGRCNLVVIGAEPAGLVTDIGQMAEHSIILAMATPFR